MKLNYRPEIDGLRAIAVLAVIFYHAQITTLDHQVFQGGFIGVDIFFVISGYLITSIILKELISTGTFSFKYFYERRIRRILPALILVMLVSFPFAWKYIIPGSFIDFSKSILYSLGFSSNFYFHFTGQQYGAESGLLKPFLHTWSLSVEEQYYILFPIILLVTFKYLRKYLGIILTLGFIISIIFTNWSIKNHPSETFYFLHTRIWELLAGSILAYFEIQLGRRSENRILNLLLPGVGIMLIGHSIFFFNDKMLHPSFYTLSPIIGVCLVVWFSGKNEVVGKILSSKLFVGTGLISYSLYLWHYPIFAFYRIKNFTPSEFDKIELIFLTFVLSIISYFFVERPFRNKKFNFKKIIYILGFAFFIILSLNFTVIFNKGYETRFSFSNKPYYIKSKEFEVGYNYDDYSNKKNVLIVGNSHGEDTLKILSLTNLKDKIYFNLASPKKRKDDYNFQIEYLLKFLEENKAKIDYYNKNWLDHLTKQYANADLIILTSDYSKEDLKILDKLIQLLKLDNKKVMIFNNALEIKQQSSYNLNRFDYYIYKNKKLPKKEELKQIEKEMFEDIDNTKEINMKIKKIAEKNNIYLIEREKIFCDLVKKKCPAVTDSGYKIYWDYSHITNEGAKYFAKKIQKNKLFLIYIERLLNIKLN